MKSIKFTALSLSLVAGLCSFVVGQSKPAGESPSLLYKISGKGISKPSYIFGTFHAICPTEMIPLESLDTYLAQTDQLMMEIDMDDPTVMPQMAKALMIPDGKTIKDFLTAEQFAKVDEMVKNALGYSAENIKMVKPAMLTVLVLTSPKTIGCTTTAYDLSLMQNAVAKQKPIIGLETVESQTQVIDSMPLEKQAKDLYKMATDVQKSVNDLKKLMAAYKARDPDQLQELSTNQLKEDKEFMTRLIDDRNAAWIPKLETAFKDKPTFVAVGAGHLGGKKGVIKLLRAKGYDVIAVKL
jgi:uncharacterized protein YbaP (TraB family)